MLAEKKEMGKRNTYRLLWFARAHTAIDGKWNSVTNSGNMDVFKWALAALKSGALFSVAKMRYL